MDNQQQEQTASQYSAIIGGSLANLGAIGSIAPLTGGYTPTWLKTAINASYGTDAAEGNNAYAIGTGDQIVSSVGGPLISYATYRLIASHPTAILCHSMKTMPILAAGWGYDVDNKKAPKGAQQLIEKSLSPQRLHLITEMLRALRFGWQSFEIIWGIDSDGSIKFDRAKPLLPELTTILSDTHGNPIGLRNTGNDLLIEKTLLFSYDGEGGNPYGRARIENIRRSWANWLNSEDNLSRLAKKAASTIPYIGYPPGNSRKTAPGQNITTGPATADSSTTGNSKIAVDMAQQMAQGRGIVYPNLAGLAMDDIRGNPDLAKNSLWSFQTLEMGNPGPMASAVIEALRYLDAMICRGYHCPERSIIEATQSGSRADSESHTDASTADSDYLHQLVTDAVQKQIVDRLMEMNYGPEAVGTVKLVAKPIADAQKIVDNKILDAVVKGNKPFVELLNHIDMDAWFARTGLPKNELAGEWDIEPEPPPTIPGVNPITGKPAKDTDGDKEKPDDHDEPDEDNGKAELSAILALAGVK